MTREDAVLAALHRLEAENRRLKRMGAAVFAVLVCLTCGFVAMPRLGTIPA